MKCYRSFRIIICMASDNLSNKKKIKYLGHILTKSNNFFLNEREIFKVSFDTKSLHILLESIIIHINTKFESVYVQYHQKHFSMPLFS